MTSFNLKTAILLFVKFQNDYIVVFDWKIIFKFEKSP